MSKRKKVLTVLKVLIFTIFLCGGIFALYVYGVVNSIDLEKILVSRPPSQKMSDKSDELEQGSLVKSKDLLTYWNWTKYPQGLRSFQKENSQMWKSLKNNEELYWLNELKLDVLKENDCEVIYCLQSRLTFPEIPSLLWRGLIGIEDYRFLNHRGVDLRALARALWHDIKVMRLEQGGSTLTQQLVKNLFYNNEKKFSRKIKEMIASTYIEIKLEKEQILQAYFNEVMWGSLQGIKIKGIAAASFFYFLKKPQDLTPFEVSILISLLKGPYYYSPVYKIERLKDRTNIVFNKLKSLDLFSDESSRWSEEAWKSWHEMIVKRSKGSRLKSLYYLSTLDEEKRTFAHFTLVREVEDLKIDLKEKYPKSDFAIKVFKKKIKSEDPPFYHYSKFERNIETAIKGERHQIGSTLKPIIYSILEEKGLDMNELVDTSPFTLELKSGPWSPKESHKGIAPQVTYEEALIKSLNRPVIRAVRDFGFENFEGLLKAKIPHLKIPLNEYPAQLLGAIELSLEELAQIYQGFLESACRPQDSSKFLLALSDPKRTTIRFRVGNKLGQMRFFGKTGTSNNGYDSWFVGFEGNELLVTWVGLEGRRDNEKEFKLYGSNSSFLIYKNFYQFRGKLFNEMLCQ